MNFVTNATSWVIDTERLLMHIILLEFGQGKTLFWNLYIVQLIACWGCMFSWVLGFKQGQKRM
jgi:hypothetical protein